MFQQFLLSISFKQDFQKRAKFDFCQYNINQKRCYIFTLIFFCLKPNTLNKKKKQEIIMIKGNKCGIFNGCIAVVVK